MWYVVARLRLTGVPGAPRLQVVAASQHYRPRSRPGELSAEMRVGPATICLQVSRALLDREGELDLPVCEPAWMAAVPGGGIWELRGEIASRTPDGEYDHGVDYADGRTLCLVALSGPRAIYRLTVLARGRDRIPLPTLGPAPILV